MINLGKRAQEEHWPDNWTATTVDGNPSAQFEETLLYVTDHISMSASAYSHYRITETGVEVLTAGKPKIY